MRRISAPAQGDDRGMLQQEEVVSYEAPLAPSNQFVLQCLHRRVGLDAELYQANLSARRVPFSGRDHLCQYRPRPAALAAGECVGIHGLLAGQLDPLKDEQTVARDHCYLAVALDDGAWRFAHPF